MDFYLLFNIPFICLQKEDKLSRRPLCVTKLCHPIRMWCQLNAQFHPFTFAPNPETLPITFKWHNWPFRDIVTSSVGLKRSIVDVGLQNTWWLSHLSFTWAQWQYAGSMFFVFLSAVSYCICNVHIWYLIQTQSPFYQTTHKRSSKYVTQYNL